MSAKINHDESISRWNDNLSYVLTSGSTNARAVISTLYIVYIIQFTQNIAKRKVGRDLVVRHIRLSRDRVVYPDAAGCAERKIAKWSEKRKQKEKKEKRKIHRPTRVQSVHYVSRYRPTSIKLAICGVRERDIVEKSARRTVNSNLLSAKYRNSQFARVLRARYKWSTVMRELWWSSFVKTKKKKIKHRKKKQVCSASERTCENADVVVTRSPRKSVISLFSWMAR